MIPSPPGDTIRDLLEERGWSQTQLARYLGHGYSLKHVNQVILGKVPISVAFALDLERLFKVPADFWLIREAQYRVALARREK